MKNDDITPGLLTFIIIVFVSLIIGIVARALCNSIPEQVVTTITAFVILVVIALRGQRWRVVLIRVGCWCLKVGHPSLGLERVYTSFEKASNAILLDFQQANTVAILIQLGRGVIGGRPSLLLEAAKKHTEKEFKMRLLYAGINSPYLSNEQADQRKSLHVEWKTAVENTKGSIQTLQQNGVKLEAWSHREPYLWRLFFFDDRLYCMPYIFQSDNQNKAPVLVFSGGGSGSFTVYGVFMRYFEHLWKKYAVGQ